MRSVSLPEEWYKSVMGFNIPHGQDNILYFFVAGDGAAVADSLQVKLHETPTKTRRLK